MINIVNVYNLILIIVYFMYRYNNPRDNTTSLGFSSGLIKRSLNSKQYPQLTKSIPRSLYIRKVGNQIINIHNTTIRVDPSSSYNISKETIQSPKRLVLRRSKEKEKDKPIQRKRDKNKELEEF